MLDKFNELIKNNIYFRDTVYLILGLLAINFVIIIINLLGGNKNGIFGFHKKIIEYFKKVILELKVVEWLNKKDLIKLTLIVVFSSILLGGLIALLDLGFFKLRDLLI